MSSLFSELLISDVTNNDASTERILELTVRAWERVSEQNESGTSKNTDYALFSWYADLALNWEDAQIETITWAPRYNGDFAHSEITPEANKIEGFGSTAQSFLKSSNTDDFTIAILSIRAPQAPTLSTPLDITISPTELTNGTVSTGEDTRLIPLRTVSAVTNPINLQAKVGPVTLSLTSLLTSEESQSAISIGDHIDVARYAINGTTELGQSLTGSRSRNDGDGHSDETEQWQWQRSADSKAWTTIDNATTNTYTTIKTHDEGQYLRLAVDYTDANPKAFSYTVYSAPIFIPYVDDGDGSYKITGLASDNTNPFNSDLTATLTESDPDGDDLNPSFQWQRSSDKSSWENVEGGINSNYTTVQDQDEGQHLRLITSHVDLEGFPSTLESDPIFIPFWNDGNATYAISETPVDGSESFGIQLTATRTEPDPDGDADELTPSFQWQRSRDGSSWSTIDGANNSSYITSKQHDEGKQLRLITFYTDAEGFDSEVKSNPVSIPFWDDGNATYTISGLPEDNSDPSGIELTATLTDSDPDGDGQNHSFQWQRSSDESFWEDIEGANDSSYITIQENDEGQHLRLSITHTDAEGHQSTLTANSLFIPLWDHGDAVYAISGLPSDGAYPFDIELTAELLESDPDGDDLSPSFQWQRSNNGSSWSVIDGANESSYTTIRQHDEGRYLRLITQYADGEGHAATLESDAILVPQEDGDAVYAISGLPEDGSQPFEVELTAQLTESDPDGDDLNPSFQWQRSSDKSSWENVEGGINSNYTTVQDQDEGQHLRLITSHVDLEGFPSTLESDPIFIPFWNDGNATYSIDGLNVSGLPLNARLSSSDPDGMGPQPVVLQWQKWSSTGWVNLGSSTESFTPTTELIQQELRVQAIYTDAEGFRSTVHSNPITVEAPNQTISFHNESLNYQPGGTLRLPLTWQANTQQIDLQGLSLNLHYNDDYLTSIDSISMRAGLPQPKTEIISDTSGTTSSEDTNKILNLSWPNAGPPQKTSENTSFLELNFKTSEESIDPINGSRITTSIRLSGIPSAGYSLDATDDVILNAQPFNLDVDGDGAVNALGDGLMIIRKLFGPAFAGSALTNKAQVGNFRTTEEIHEFIQQGIDSKALDIDGDNKVSALGDGLMIIRRLFGSAFSGTGLVDKALSPTSSFLPTNGNGAPLPYESLSSSERSDISAQIARAIDALNPEKN